MSQTLFAGPGIQLWEDSVSDGAVSPARAAFSPLVSSFPNLTWRQESVAIAALATRNIAPMLLGASEQWAWVILRVVGRVKINTAGIDQSSNPVAGIVECSGTTLLPGILMLMTWKISSITLEGIDAASTVELLAGVATVSTDARL